MFYTICISSLVSGSGHLQVAISASVSVLVSGSLFCFSLAFSSGGLPSRRQKNLSTQSVSASFLLLGHQPKHPYRATRTAFQLPHSCPSPNAPASKKHA